MHGLRYSQCMGGAVEEIGVAERDVPGARRHLLSDVGDDHVHRHDAEPALVHRHHRTVPAPVFASARGFGESGRARRAVGHHDGGVAVEGGEGVAQRRAEGDLREVVDHPEGGARRSGPHAFSEVEEMRLVLASDNSVHPEPAQAPRVHRCVQAVGAQYRARGQGPDLGQHLECDPGRGVHRQVDGDHAGAGQCIGAQAIDRQIAAAHVETGIVEPSRRLREPERLASEFVGADEDDSDQGIGAP